MTYSFWSPTKTIVFLKCLQPIAVFIKVDLFSIYFTEEEFEDTKGVISICKLKVRQYIGQTIYKTLHRKLKIEQHEPH